MSRRFIKALVVEPIRELAEILSIMLEQMQFDAECVLSTGYKDTLELLDKNYFDLFFVSELSPPDQANNLISAIRKREGESPVIYICKEGQTKAGFAAVRAGASDFLIRGDITKNQTEQIILTCLERAVRDRNYHQDFVHSLLLNEHTIDGVAITEDRKILLINRAFVEMFGYREAQITGLSISKFFNIQLMPVKGQEEKVQNKFVGIGLKKDGTQFPIHIQRRTSFNQGRRFYIYSVQDYTHQVIERSAFKKRSRFYKALLEMSDSNYLVVNPKGDIQYATPSLANSLDIEKHWLIGKNLFDLVRNHDKAVVRRLLEKAPYKGKRPSPDNIRIKISGNRWCLAEFQVILVEKQFRECKIAFQVAQVQNNALKGMTSSAFHKAKTNILAQIASDLIWEWNISTNELSFINSACEGFRLSDRFAIKTWAHFEKYIHPQDRQRLNRALWEHIRSCRTFQIEIRLRASESGYRLFRLKGSCLGDNTGTSHIMIGAIMSMRIGVDSEFPSQESESAKGLPMEAEIKRALECDEFILHYQPIISLKNGQITGFESLVRWQHPAKGLLSPAQFLPMVEDAGLMPALGEWVLRKACQQHQKWKGFVEKPLKLSVNFSTSQIKDRNIVQMVKCVLAETGMSAAHLEIDIKEHEESVSKASNANILRELADSGIHIAIDDFDGRQSSLGKLDRFPNHTLKMDGSFLQDIFDNARNQAMVLSIIDMAKELNLNLVAEGVETQKQLEFLSKHQCDEAQGYAISKPLPSSDFVQLFNHPRRRATSFNG